MPAGPCNFGPSATEEGTANPADSDQVTPVGGEVGTVWSAPVVEHPAGRPSWPAFVGAGAPPGAVAPPGSGAAPGVAPGGLAAAGGAGLGLVAAWSEWYPLTVDLDVVRTHHDLRAGEGRHLPHLTVRGHEPGLPAARRGARAGHDPPLKDTRDTCHGVAVPVRVRNT